MEENKETMSFEQYLKEFENQLFDMSYRGPLSKKDKEVCLNNYQLGLTVVEAADDFLNY